MAPTTRSKASNTGNVPAVASAPSTKAASGKTKKAKTPKRPAAATKPEATPSRVQKKKKSSPKNKKQKSKGKNRHLSAETSVKSSSKASSKSSLEASSRQSTSKTPRPAAHAAAQDDFPELAQAIGILPFLDHDTLQPPSTPRTPLLNRTDHVLRPDHDVLMNQLAHHMVNPPAWSTSRPGTGSSNGSKISGFGAYLPRGFELAESPPPGSASQRDRSRSGSPDIHVHYDRRRRDPSRGSKRSGSSVVRDIVSQVEGQSEESEAPVSVKNAHVFKRPTVADVRRERQLMHNELRDWTGRLRRARDDFDAVIEEIESRMQVIRAVNRMQAPLKKAPLGLGR